MSEHGSGGVRACADNPPLSIILSGGSRSGRSLFSFSLCLFHLGSSTHYPKSISVVLLPSDGLQSDALDYFCSLSFCLWWWCGIFLALALRFMLRLTGTLTHTQAHSSPKRMMLSQCRIFPLWCFFFLLYTALSFLFGNLDPSRLNCLFFFCYFEHQNTNDLLSPLVHSCRIKENT